MLATLIKGAPKGAPEMVSIDVSCNLESFRKFVLASTCKSFAPEAYLDDGEIFPERDEGGVIYVEAVDKVTLKKMRNITFVNAREVLGIIYNSNSGSTSVKWRQTHRYSGRATGEISANSLMNLAESGVLDTPQIEDCVDRLSKEKSQ